MQLLLAVNAGFLIDPQESNELASEDLDIDEEDS